MVDFKKALEKLRKESPNMAQEITPFQDFQSNIRKMEPQFKNILPPSIKPEKFAQVAITAIQLKPSLLELNRQSLYTSLTQCAADGLIPDGREAAIVPFKGQAKYMPMVQGITKKARNSGEISSIDALVVYANDQYESWVDEKGQHFMHKKAKGERGAAILTYAYAITKDGGFFFEEISEEQMYAIEQCSKANDSPWKGPFRDEMKRKSALRRLCKYRLPSSSDLEKTLSADDDIYDLSNTPAEEKTEPKTTSSKLSDAVSGKGKTEATDADIVKPDPVQPAPEPEPKNTPTGIELKGMMFDELSSKEGETNGKKWTKYGGKCLGKWYGTFDRKFYEIMVTSKANRKLVNIKYLEKSVGDKIYFEIIDLVYSTIDDAEIVSQGKPKNDLPF